MMEEAYLETQGSNKLFKVLLWKINKIFHSY